MMRVAQSLALEFDKLQKKLIEERNIDALLDPQSLSDAGKLLVPMDDHYRPMLNTLAFLHDHEHIEFFNEEIDLGSVSMRSFKTV